MATKTKGILDQLREGRDVSGRCHSGQKTYSRYNRARQLLLHAIDDEEKAIAFYDNAAAQTKEPIAVKRGFEEIGKDEREHLAKLNDALLILTQEEAYR